MLTAFLNEVIREDSQPSFLTAENPWIEGGGVAYISIFEP